MSRLFKANKDSGALEAFAEKTKYNAFAFDEEDTLMIHRYSQETL